MVNLKTKFDKHANDNEKRRKSIKEREKAKSNQSQIIKQALSNSALSNNSSKKIIFNETDDFEIETENSNNFRKTGENGKSALFESSDSEAEDFEFKEKSQFSGKKGFELLNLQSTYGNDERFKIDERFLEEEEEEEIIEEDSTTPVDADGDEKAKQLKILESVLGAPVVTSEKEKKAKKRTAEMVRYDASNKEHGIYEINNQTETTKTTKKLTPSQKRREQKEKKEKMKTTKTEIEDSPVLKVSKEKFYEVSNEMKNLFKEKNEEGGQFSLLGTYGSNGAAVNEESEEDLAEEGMEESENNCEMEMEHEIEEKVVMEKPKSEEKGVLARGIWKEPFFFAQDDPRFKEGLDFINKKNSEEASTAAENYDKTRKRLKEILRLHVKKQMHKKNPFKNKIGGMNKKQLASSKSKNHRMTFNNRRPPKKNFGGRT